MDESHRIPEEKTIWQAVKFLRPSTKSERQSCFTQIAEIIDLFRQPDTKIRDEEIARQRHEIGELFLQIAQKLETFGETGEGRMCFDLNTDLFGVEYLCDKDGKIHTKEGDKPRSYDEIIDIFTALSCHLSYEHNERIEELKAPEGEDQQGITRGRKRGRKPTVWQKILLAKQCYELFNGYRPGEARQTAGDFPDFVQHIYETASGDQDPKLDHAIRMAFGVREQNEIYHELVTYGEGWTFGPGEKS